MNHHHVFAVAFLLLFVACQPAFADAATDNNAGGLHTVDFVLIGIYGIATIALGYYFGRRQKSTKEYFVGSGAMNPILVGVSLFATLLSTISYLSMPGEALGKGPGFLAIWLSVPLVYLFVAYVLLPVYMKHKVTSAYELLESKLGLSIRLLGAVMFIVLRLVWMSLLVYLAARALAVIMRVEYCIFGFASWAKAVQVVRGDAVVDWIAYWQDGQLYVSAVLLIVLFTGFVSVIYTSLGGLRAVVITDFMQTVLLFGGALLVIGMVTYLFGGFGWFPTTWQDNWDTQPIISFDPSTRVTIVGSICMFFVWVVCTTGGDQTSVQRFMATEDVSAARRAFAMQLAVSVLVGVTLSLVGFSLLSYFRTYPELMPADWTIAGKADQLFPRFVGFHLPIGIAGLVVAAMFAAAMSSIDSGVNSITAVVMTDFLDRFGYRPQSERGHVIFAKLLAFTIGAVVVVGSSFIGNVPGNITAVTQKTVNLLTTPIFALFFFALFVPFARPAGVWAGAICGVAVATFIAFSGPIVDFLAQNYGVAPTVFGVDYQFQVGGRVLRNPNGFHAAVGAIGAGVSNKVLPDPISFQWIGPIAITVNLAVGCIVSLLIGNKSSAGVKDE